MSATDLDTKEQWHLDKKVPIALILFMTVQTFGAIWWASSLTERVAFLERATVNIGPSSDRLTRVETKVEQVQVDVREIKTDIKSLVRGQ
jgi:hypothetical protein